MYMLLLPVDIKPAYSENDISMVYTELLKNTPNS